MLRQAHTSTSSYFDKLMLRQAPHDEEDSEDDNEGKVSGTALRLTIFILKMNFISYILKE